MKVGEIWETKDQYREKVSIKYLEKFPENSERTETYIGYTYLKNPRDPEQDKEEEMIALSWFINMFRKCHE